MRTIARDLCLTAFLATSLFACTGDDSAGPAPDAGAASDSGGAHEGGADATVSDASTDATGPTSDAPGADAADATMTDTGTGSLAVIPGYSLSVFALGGSTYSHPDSLELDGTHVWVGYNMGVKSKDGTDAGPPWNSTVVQYNLDGSLAGKTFDIPGHCDGVRVDPATHLVWATSNEDGNPLLWSYDPTSGAITKYTFAAPAHGGGLDDMAFVGGKMIVADSNPQKNPNTDPALSVVQVSGTTATFAPFLLGNATAFSPAADAGTTLNLLDPDSLSIDDQGNLVLVDQGDSQIVVMSPTPGDGGFAQSVAVYPVGTQLDDTVWATSASGMLLVADEVADAIYAVHATFTPGTIYTEAPNDSLVAGFVGTLDLSSGTVTPILVGVKKPTGLLFVKQ